MEDKELQHAHPPGGHELKDVNHIAITKFGIGLSLTLVVTVFVMWGLFHYFVTRDEKAYNAGAQLPPAVVNALKEPPQPRLQQSPRIDMREMREAEDQLLHHYTWVDRDKGVVRLPIERAMDVLAQRGLKSRPAEPSGTTGGQPQPVGSAGGSRNVPTGTVPASGSSSSAAGDAAATGGRRPGAPPDRPVHSNAEESRKTK